MDRWIVFMLIAGATGMPMAIAYGKRTVFYFWAAVFVVGLISAAVVATQPGGVR